MLPLEGSKFWNIIIHFVKWYIISFHKINSKLQGAPLMLVDLTDKSMVNHCKPPFSFYRIKGSFSTAIYPTLSLDYFHCLSFTLLVFIVE